MTGSQNLLAEYLVMDVLCGCADTQRSTIFSGITVDQAAHALTLLGHAAQDRHPDTEALITAALTAEVETMAYAVLRIGRQFPGTFTPQLAGLLDTVDLDVVRLRDLAGQVPYPSRELNGVALVLTTRIVDLDTESPAATQATWRSWHALRLAESGRRAEALVVSGEAVTLRRELVAGNRDAYLPNLATSLWMTAHVCLTIDGPMDHAVDSAEEAVRLFQQLTHENPAAFADRLHAAAEVLARVHDARGDTDAAVSVRTQFNLLEST